VHICPAHISGATGHCALDTALRNSEQICLCVSHVRTEWDSVPVRPDPCNLLRPDSIPESKSSHGRVERESAAEEKCMCPQLSLTLECAQYVCPQSGTFNWLTLNGPVRAWRGPTRRSQCFTRRGSARGFCSPSAMPPPALGARLSASPRLHPPWLAWRGCPVRPRTAAQRARPCP